MAGENRIFNCDRRSLHPFHLARIFWICIGPGNHGPP